MVAYFKSEVKSDWVNIYSLTVSIISLLKYLFQKLSLEQGIIPFSPLLFQLYMEHLILTTSYLYLTTIFLDHEIFYTL